MVQYHRGPSRPVPTAKGPRTRPFALRIPFESLSETLSPTGDFYRKMDPDSGRRPRPLPASRQAKTPIPRPTPRKTSQNPGQDILQARGSFPNRLAQSKHSPGTGLLCGRRGTSRALDRDGSRPMGYSTGVRCQSDGAEVYHILGSVCL